jgi:hypothetical protein
MDVFIEIKYFNTDVGICADDFKNTDRTAYLNPNLISEISDLQMTSGTLAIRPQKYFTIHMNNKRGYFCRESEFEKIKKRIQ